ncbi:hypothetical protein [Actinomadura rayongensis]|jgi:hypothetical protein|uniref:Uncharacterized protein n=1 Tax=Actinomadura rayongensis TaxID=1429076 RepID=A0A6I4W8U9_9ACTN|nr:hypothetical protein [Actinomadura rayongensis]MXQ65230.1 hypothetical protein [Actinomadura rayongensis]
MTRPRLSTRRHLPTSPFAPPAPAAPLETFEVDDRVTHDAYGLGTVVGVESNRDVLVDFSTRKVRIRAPYARMYKL